MADFNVNHITGKQGQQGPVLAGITTVSSTGAMRIPSGSSAYRGNGGRGITGSGWNPNSVRTIDYYQIASTGNATGWGDVIGYGAALAGSASNNTRGLTAGGFGAGRGRFGAWRFAPFAAAGRCSVRPDPWPWTAHGGGGRGDGGGLRHGGHSSWILQPPRGGLGGGRRSVHISR